MKTLEEVKGRCFIDEEGHWIWRGAKHCKTGPRIYAPVLPDGQMESQPGRRAVWQMAKGLPINKGWRVYGRCDEPMCVNPEHIACGPSDSVGRHIAKTGKFKGQPKRIAANRAIGRKRASYTPEQLAEVRASDESGSALVARLGLGRGVISRLKLGTAVAFEPVGGLFSGLVLANQESRRSA